MTTDEKLAVIARAILDLAARSAREWDYDGEQIVATGVQIDALLETALRQIAKETELSG